MAATRKLEKYEIYCFTARKCVILNVRNHDEIT